MLDYSHVTEEKEQHGQSSHSWNIEQSEDVQKMIHKRVVVSPHEVGIDYLFICLDSIIFQSTKLRLKENCLNRDHKN